MNFKTCSLLTLGLAYVSTGCLAAGEPAKAPAKPVSTDGEASSEIVVTGRKEAEVRLAKRFVATVTAPISDGRLARWNEPICARAYGVRPEIGSIVTAKINAEARTAGIELARSKCKANVLVVFTPNKAQFIASLEKRRSSILSGSPSDYKALMDETRPVAWWYTNRTEGADGSQIQDTSSMLATQLTSQTGPSIPNDGHLKFLDGYSNSLIKTNSRFSINSVVVVVDTSKSEGYKLSSVSAFAAMVSLGHISVNAEAVSGDSVLRLFAEPAASSPEIDLSSWDRAYLKGLYSVSATRDGVTQRAALAVRISELLGSN